ncbi:zinc-dependent alcohol dehydrogenase family protein [Aggregicoccus sp. 17bor-14]|uniref:zinc-dependent alcohol dehydrogenase family protein n=1 Tax=Myxococcaceae TaxID=31 RepID=UPI00129D0441|nr:MULTISPECIES: zinc-dependent alcohol dehydrogenase family protein [Myxococcaceae]MBF5042447.1 zinc-dependent alcohol dehydrogenase family protein [Simulacricoccus sp. 17bor-14]MRI88218.1 zinc-dependent alcohol dehydrogenase family protein [Aggregicoccus sp. 17bor-14]
MRAMVIPRFGGPEVFEEREVKIPPPGPYQLLVRVRASGTNPVDAKLRQDGSWAGLKLPAVIGYDVSGTVEAVGPGVTDFHVGDAVFYTPEIFGNPWGSYAELNLVNASIVAPKPMNLSHEEAAAVPLAGGTAWEALARRIQLHQGETILIHGGAGGVGSFAVQMARAVGARVLATAGTENQETLRRLGAHVAIDYRKEDPAEVALRETDGTGVDAVFDTAGVNILPSLRATRTSGRLATILGVQGDLSLLYQKNQTLHGVFLLRERERLEEMTQLIEKGGVKPLVEQVLSLNQVAEAHRRLDSGHGRGKLVLKVAP